MKKPRARKARRLKVVAPPPSRRREKPSKQAVPADWHDAMAQAKKRFGRAGVVGRDEREAITPYVVGVREHGYWVQVGRGANWAEAFKDVHPASEKERKP